MGSPTLQSGGQNQKWPTNKTGGYITPAVWEVPNASERGQNQRWPRGGPRGYITLAVREVTKAPRFEALGTPYDVSIRPPCGPFLILSPAPASLVSNSEDVPPDGKPVQGNVKVPPQTPQSTSPLNPPTSDDTRPYMLILGKRVKVPKAYPKGTEGWLVNNQ